MSRDYLKISAASFLARNLPRGFAYWIGLRIADRFYAYDRRGREAVVSNLRRILAYKGVRASEDTLHLMDRKTFQNFGKYLVDFLRYSRITRRQVRRLVNMEHMEHLEEAVAMGKGVLVVSAHLGSTEIGGGVLSALGYKLNGVVLPEPDRRINDLFQNMRVRRGVNVITIGDAVGGVARALQRNELVALMADRDYSGHSRVVDFFGAPARLPRGPAILAAKIKAPVVVVFVLREPDDTYMMRVYPPILPGSDATPQEIHERLCWAMEKEIGANPSQWYMFDEFWGNEDSVAHNMLRE